MSLTPLPATACWQHRVARSGFEVAYFQAAPGGCLDVDLESSALTNALPVHRLALAAGAGAAIPAAYCTLVYDSSSLVLDYPGIAVRVG